MYANYPILLLGTSADGRVGEGGEKDATDRVVLAADATWWCLDNSRALVSSACNKSPPLNVSRIELLSLAFFASFS